MPDIFTPTVFSALGDMIFEDASGQVHWLNTGTAQVSVAASSTVEFWRNLNGDLLDELFLPPLIKQLRKAGKILGPNQCYSYTTLPIFAQGSYSVENIYVLSCREHFGVTGGIHRQIRDMPDGQKSTA
ncbi:MAG: DUF1851 domain-containing protein [Hyphomicrobiales bacterium]|nr:DUF1851 domain-containing protein [Hyphomicrobiales bacterium]